MADKPKMKEFLLNVGDNPEDEDAIFRTSLVDNPATQKLFAIFSSQENNKNLDFKVIEPTPENKQKVAKTDNFERIISGVWFMPDTDYLRSNSFENFTTRMTRSELKKAVTNFLKAGNVNQFDADHNGRPLSGLQAIETWILEDYSQSSPVMGYKIEDLGYKKEDIPLGTVFMTVFIQNEKFFNEKILTQKVRGFSIEGLFYLTEKRKENMQNYKEMFAQLGLEVPVGTSLLLPDGKKMTFSENGVMLDGKAAPNGEYATKLEKFKVVVKDGKLVDFGFDETAAVVTETPAVKVETPTTKVETAPQKTEAEKDAEINAKVEAILAKKEAEKQAKAEADAKEAARLQELKDKDAEIERLKKDVKVPKEKTPVGEYNKETHTLKKVGGREILVPKR